MSRDFSSNIPPEGLLGGQSSKKRTFYHNWLDNVDQLMQLLLSEAIWKAGGGQSGKPVNVNSVSRNPSKNLNITDFYIDSSRWLSFRTFQGNLEEKENPSWTIITYNPNVGTNRQETGRKSSGQEALWRS